MMMKKKVKNKMRKEVEDEESWKKRLGRRG